VRGSRAAWCAALVAGALAALPCIVAAQVLYKWTDGEGRVQYSDQPPKNFTGPVTKIEPDEKPTPSPAPASARDGKPSTGNDHSRDMIEMAEKKRAVRDKLEANLEAARARLVAAQAALDNATPGDGEHQAVQQRRDLTTSPPSALPNCSVAKNASGTPIQTCHAVIPGAAYYDRQQSLQDDVKKAQDDVAAAETAYRRGVD
jgi:Domain of unknown function (DUF4124)